MMYPLRSVIFTVIVLCTPSFADHAHAQSFEKSLLCEHQTTRTLIKNMDTPAEWPRGWKAAETVAKAHVFKKWCFSECKAYAESTGRNVCCGVNPDETPWCQIWLDEGLTEGLITHHAVRIKGSGTLDVGRHLTGLGITQYLKAGTTPGVFSLAPVSVCQVGSVEVAAPTVLSDRVCHPLDEHNEHLRPPPPSGPKCPEGQSYDPIVKRCTVGSAPVPTRGP